MPKGVPQRRSLYTSSCTSRKLMALVMLLTQFAPPPRISCFIPEHDRALVVV